MPSQPTRPEFQCPDGETLRALRAKTPVAAVDLIRLRETALALGKAHAVRRLAWLPRTGWAGVPAVAQALHSAGAVSISCDSLEEASSTVAAQGMLNVPRQAVTILLPPVIGDGPNQLAMLARQTAVSVVVDHFAQAERLANACRANSSTIDILLRVDIGRERLGVRPGPDLHDLAGGVARLPGVRLSGISVGTTTVESNGVSGLKRGELARLLARCRSSLTRAGFSANVISISRLADLGDAHDESETSVATQTRTALPDGVDDPFFVVAGVIGRPTRNQAVIDAGREWLGEAASVLWPSGRHTRIVAIEDGFAVLHILPTGHGLVIGDTVALVPSHPLRSPAHALQFDDVSGWRIEPRAAFSGPC